MKKNKHLKLFFIFFNTLLILLIVLNSIYFKKVNIIEGNINYRLTKEKKEIFDVSLAQKVTEQNYGDWAEYKVDLNDNGIYTDDWKIFYNDGTYVYLIAADYLDNSKIPNEAKMTAYDEHNAYWDASNNFAGKNGMSDVTDETAEQFMLTKYKKNAEYANVTDINSKATAVLLDTNIWKDFALGFEGSFAYGSPTVEMWVASWNQKGYTNLKDGVKKEENNYEFDCDELSEEYKKFTTKRIWI